MEVRLTDDRWAEKMSSTRVPSFLPVTSLGLVSPGAATDGVTPIFLQLTTFLVFSSTVSPLTTFFAHRCHFFYFTQVSVTPRGCHPRKFYLSNLVSPLFFVNSGTFFHSGVPGSCPPPIVTSLIPSKWIDDTDDYWRMIGTMISYSCLIATTALSVFFMEIFTT